MIKVVRGPVCDDRSPLSVLESDTEGGIDIPVEEGALYAAILKMETAEKAHDTLWLFGGLSRCRRQHSHEAQEKNGLSFHVDCKGNTFS